jgi:transcriptional regulator with XRE-family HTH domain
MATSTTFGGTDTLPSVTDETTGQRVRRERKALNWRQVDLADAAGVKPETVSNVERDLPTAGDERPSVPLLLDALEAERLRRARTAPPEPREDVTRVLMEFLARPDLEDVRVRRIGPNRKTRFIGFVLPDPDATPEQIQQDLEDFHREQRRNDPPKG